MKVEKEHRVPLSVPAIELLKSIQANTQSQGYIFPAPRGSGVLSDMSLTTFFD